MLSFKNGLKIRLFFCYIMTMGALSSKMGQMKGKPSVY